MAVDNRPDTGPGARARKRADVVRWTPKNKVRLGKQFVVEGAADVRSELLVEELLELKRSPPLRRILWVERRAQPALLDLRDDSGRVPDRPGVEGEHRRRRGIAG
jgi:hypothetical protein